MHSVVEVLVDCFNGCHALYSGRQVVIHQMILVEK